MRYILKYNENIDFDDFDEEEVDYLLYENELINDTIKVIRYDMDNDDYYIYYGMLEKINYEIKEKFIKDILVYISLDNINDKIINITESIVDNDSPNLSLFKEFIRDIIKNHPKELLSYLPEHLEKKYSSLLLP